MAVNVPIVTTMQAPTLYHSSGDVFEVVSKRSQERVAHLMVLFVNAIDRASKQQID